MGTAPEQLEHKAVDAQCEEETAATEPPGEELVLEDLLVDDVSIDGMCGVY